MDHHQVLRVISKLLVPPIFLFALYVQFHGDYGPGGGFQAGVIFGAAFILYGLVFGVAALERVIPIAVSRWLAAGGVLIYALVGVWAMLRGGTFLDYSALSTDPVAGQHLGILLIEFGVGVTVSGVMVMVFFAFAAAREPD